MLNELKQFLFIGYRLIIFSLLYPLLQLLFDYVQKLAFGDCIFIIEIERSSIFAVNEIAEIFMLIRSFDMSAFLDYIAYFFAFLVNSFTYL